MMQAPADISIQIRNEIYQPKNGHFTVPFRRNKGNWPYWAENDTEKMVDISFQLNIKQIIPNFYRFLLIKTIQNGKKWTFLKPFFIDLCIQSYQIYRFKIDLSNRLYRASVIKF